MKIKQETIFAILAVAALSMYMGWLTVPGVNLNVNDGGVATTQPGTQSVTKPVIFTVTDRYGGSALSSQTIYVYDQNLQLLETLTTDAAGQKYTSMSHTSGTKLYCNVVGSTGERKWFDVVVPSMSAADADSLSQIPVSLPFYDYSAPTVSVMDQAGTSIADTDNYNKTTTGDTGVLTVNWFQGTTGDGYDSSYDPIYQMNNDAVLVLKLSGTNYENVVVSGMSGGIERGSAKYYYKVIDPTTLTKWQVGNDFRYGGVGSHTVSLGLSGYSGDAADADFYIYYFSDWNYWVQNGSWGPNSLSVVAGAPHTVNLID